MKAQVAKYSKDLAEYTQKKSKVFKKMVVLKEVFMMKNSINFSMKSKKTLYLKGDLLDGIVFRGSNIRG